MNSNVRVVGTPHLERLVHTAKTLGLNRYPDLRQLRLEPRGLHVLELVLPNHQGHRNRDVVHHRVSVMARVMQPMDSPLEPATFFLDIRAEDWDELVDAESMQRALAEIR